MLVAFEHGAQEVMDPIRQIGVQAVIDPLALPTIRQQTTRSQLCQVPGDFRLALVQGAGQLANTQLPFSSDEQHRAHPSVVRQAFENSDRCQRVSDGALKDAAGHLEISFHIRFAEYMVFRI